MPYSSTAELPAYVKKLPDTKQRQWQHVFNSCMADGHDEGQCFKMANGVVKKDVDDWEPEGDVADGDDLEQAVKSYQYIESYEYETRKLSQEAAVYNPVGGTGTKACSNCVFFISPARCAVVSGEIAPNGLSKQWRAVPSHEQVPIPVIIVKSGEKRTTPLVSFFNKVRGVSEPPVTESLCVVKQTDGSLRWFTRYSNAWEDRDAEILTEAAHKEYVEWATTGKAYPELWLWHTPGTRFGVADWVGFNDGFACASGLIDAGKETVVETLKGLGDLGVSHGFLHAKEGKYITKYRTFEISVLPMKRASVWTTNFSVAGKEAMMAFNKDSRDFLVATMGEDWVKQQEIDQKAQADRLRALGVEYKSIAEEVKADAEAPAPAVMHSEGFKAISTQISDLAAQVAALTGAVTAVKGDVDTLKTGDETRIDEAVSKAFTSKAATVAARPTEDAANLLRAAGFGAGVANKDVDPQAAADQWLFEHSAKMLTELGAHVPNGGVGTPSAARVTVEAAAE